MKQIERNDPCWCGSGKKYKKCHEAFDHKLNHLQGQGHLVPDREFDTSIIRKVLQSLIIGLFFLSTFLFYYLVIFSDICYNANRGDNYASDNIEI